MDDIFSGLAAFFAGSGVLERFLPEDFFPDDGKDFFVFLVGVLERFGVLTGVVDALRREERRTGIVIYFFLDIKFLSMLKM